MKTPLLLKEASSSNLSGFRSFFCAIFTFFIAILLISYFTYQHTQNATLSEQLENTIGTLDSCTHDICNRCEQINDPRLRRNLVDSSNQHNSYKAFEYGLPAEGFGVLPHARPDPNPGSPPIEKCVACCGMFLKGLLPFNGINCDGQHLNDFICLNCNEIGTKCKADRDIGVCWKVASRSQTEGEHQSLFTCLRQGAQIDRYGSPVRSMVLAPPLIEESSQSLEVHSFPPGEKV